MNDNRSGLSPEVKALLERERSIPPVSPAVRNRALARARAAVAAGLPATPVSRPVPVYARWAVAAAIMLVAAAAVGAASYELRARSRAQVQPPRAAAPAVVRVAAAAPVAPEVEAPDAEPVSPPHPALVGRAPTGNAGREEVRLLRQARDAVAHKDFVAALRPIAEHARRFRDGRLAEEREALRVRALAGMGRTDEARRAAARFEARFPRSVLLPAVRQMPTAAP